MEGLGGTEGLVEGVVLEDGETLLEAGGELVEGGQGRGGVAVAETDGAETGEHTVRVVDFKHQIGFRGEGERLVGADFGFAVGQDVGAEGGLFGFDVDFGG